MPRLILFVGLLLTAAGVVSAEPVSEKIAWTATLTNRTQDTKATAGLVLRQDGTKLTGTVTLAGKDLAVVGKREGAWVELVWTDATGRIIQLRAVISRTDGRGTFISGGGGNLVEYGRVLIEFRPAAK